MILATRTLNGKTQYVNAFTGRKVFLERLIGRGQNRLPDIARHYLTPGLKAQANEPPASVKPNLSRLERRASVGSASPKPRKSWFKQVMEWLKNRF